MLVGRLKWHIYLARWQVWVVHGVVVILRLVRNGNAYGCVDWLVLALINLHEFVLLLCRRF